MPNFERQGSLSEPATHLYPAIIGGQCEFCGVMDKFQPAEVQYNLCPHFKSMGQVQCSYCPQETNPVDVIKQRKIMIHGSPTNPGEVIAVCDDFKCSQKHLQRFKRNI